MTIANLSGVDTLDFPTGVDSVAKSGGTLTVNLSGSTGIDFTTARHEYMYFGSTTVNNTAQFSCAPNTSGASGVVTAPTATDPGSLRFTTAASLNAQATFTLNGNSPNPLQCTLGILTLFRTRIKLVATSANERIWIGLGDAMGSTNMKSNTPAQNVVGFRYSTGTDTNWTCYVGTSAVNNSTSNSGVAPDTNMHVYEIAWDGANVLFYIDGNQVGSLSGSTVPTTSTALDAGWSIDNNTGSTSKSVDFTYMMYETAG